MNSLCSLHGVLLLVVCVLSFPSEIFSFTKMKSFPLRSSTKSSSDRMLHRQFLGFRMTASGRSFEFGEQPLSSSSKNDGACTEMVRLTPCYFDSRRGCQVAPVSPKYPFPSSRKLTSMHQSRNSICPIDGRRCAADRTYFDEEYGSRVYEDFETVVDVDEKKTSDVNEMMTGEQQPQAAVQTEGQIHYIHLITSLYVCESLVVWSNIFMSLVM